MSMCTCPWDRNDPTCASHRYAWSWRTRTEPIWAQLALDMDLNWSGPTAHLLFWQHTRLPEWPFVFDTYTVAGASVLREPAQRDDQLLTIDLIDDLAKGGLR